MLTETVAGVPMWALVATAGAILVLLVVVIVVVARPKKKAAPKPAPRRVRTPAPAIPPDPTAGALLVMDFSKAGAAGLRELHSPDEPLPGRFVDGQLVLASGEGVRSRAETEVLPGESFRFEYDVQVVEDDENGVSANYLAGPLIMDANGVVLTWWFERDPINKAAGLTHGYFDVVAPPGAAKMALGVCSSYSHDGMHSKAQFAFARAWVKRAP